MSLRNFGQNEAAARAGDRAIRLQREGREAAAQSARDREAFNGSLLAARVEVRVSSVAAYGWLSFELGVLCPLSLPSSLLSLAWRRRLLVGLTRHDTSVAVRLGAHSLFVVGEARSRRTSHLAVMFAVMFSSGPQAVRGRRGCRRGRCTVSGR